MQKIKIKDIEITYEYYFRDVKLVRYELTERHLKVIIPLNSNKDVEKHIRIKEDWIYRKVMEYECSVDRLYEKDYHLNEIKIRDKTIKYAVEYKKLKYVRYRLYKNMLFIKLPSRYNKTINETILKKEKWLYKNIVKWEKREEELKELSKDKHLLNRTSNQFKNLCNHYLDLYQKKLDVTVNRVQYRSMTRKWGSCSSKRNITLSKNLVYLPDNLVAYIIYHELCHLIEMSHNDRFYELIKKEFPNYKVEDKLLVTYEYMLDRI